jgi:HK97 gp10 family phage protein
MSVKGRVDGLEASRRKLEKIIRAEQASGAAALALIGQQAVTEVQRRAPLDTGRLRRSYSWEVGSERGRSYVEVGSNIEYAPDQEFGTSSQTGKPHLRPGIEAVVPKVGKLVEEAARRAARVAGI